MTSQENEHNLIQNTYNILHIRRTLIDLSFNTGSLTAHIDKYPCTKHKRYQPYMLSLHFSNALANLIEISDFLHIDLKDAINIKILFNTHKYPLSITKVSTAAT